MYHNVNVQIIYDNAIREVYEAMEQAIGRNKHDLLVVISNYNIDIDVDNKHIAFLRELLDSENIQAMVDKYETETRKFKQNEEDLLKLQMFMVAKQIVFGNLTSKTDLIHV